MAFSVLLASWLHTSMALAFGADIFSARCSAPATGLLVHAGDTHQLWACQVGAVALRSQCWSQRTL